MSSMFIEGLVKYPDDLPCPQIETDLQPRERRYISDIGQVKKLRRFQRDYQATRQNISFVFTPEQARDFQLWYKNDIVEGGAWFYADWPILHKETGISYRFVTRPVWRVLALGNFHVSATVELYEGRKVGKYSGIFTSKLYPVIVVDGVHSSNCIEDARVPPVGFSVDDAALRQHLIVAAEWKERLLDVNVSDDARTFNHQIVSGEWTEILLDVNVCDDARTFNHQIVGGEWTARLITYPYYDEDEAAIQSHTIVAAEFVT